MRNVFVRVVVFCVMVVVMIVVMEDQFCQRLQDAIQMRRRGEVDGNVIEIEGEHARHEETNPPSRLGRREAAVILARIHSERLETIGIPVSESITYFRPHLAQTSDSFPPIHKARAAERG